MHHDGLALLGPPDPVPTERIAQRITDGVAQRIAHRRPSEVVPEVVAVVVPEVVVRRPVRPRRGLLLDQHVVQRLGARVLGRQVGRDGGGGLRVGGHVVPEHPDVALVVQGHPDRQRLAQRRPLRHRHPRLDDLLGPGRQPRGVDHQLEFAAAEGVLGGRFGGAVHVPFADHPGATAPAHRGQRDGQHQQGDAEGHDRPARHAQAEQDDEGGHGAQHRGDQLAYRCDGPVPAIRHSGPPEGQGPG